MKKITLASLLFFTVYSISSQAQFNTRTFKPAKGIASMGWVVNDKIAHEYVLSFQLEPKYGPKDWLWFGLRLGADVLVQRTLLADDYQAVGIFSIVPTVDFSWVISEKVRPFVGFGAGNFTTRKFYDGFEADPGNAYKSYMGLSPRVGIELKNFVLSVERNMLPHQLSYTCIRAGFTLGGGTVD